ncbi:G-protein-coupled receptor family protein [Cavenderia fasciculata]|uniref:G-protein-coupled receptor family protein n=1 Tax=Cavenderia fasciculata TaxID=261658 RepID=F4PH86_CACFS|nr:G-protein-coupled receptor family protein [Cavenderia fasciculata]EGG25070.1 G-protein-coupled receptor family protein [Cavenderia fasciculata]|eukprot:XP_004362921.1 G-protein-coupled receptor family protein [Cavenderia fasciculata]
MTSDNVLTAKIFELVCYILSIIGCIFIIFHFFWITLLRNSYSRIIIYPTFSILLFNFVTFPLFLSPEVVGLYIIRNTYLCFAQAALTQLSIVSNFLWSVAISINLLFLCFYPAKDIKKNDKLFHVFIWGISILIIILTRTHLGDDGNECRYVNQNDEVKFIIDALFFGSIMLFNLVVQMVTLKQAYNGTLRPYYETKSLMNNDEKRNTTKKIVWRLMFYPGVLSICYMMLLVLHIFIFTRYKISEEHYRTPPPPDYGVEVLTIIARGLFVLQEVQNYETTTRNTEYLGKYSGSSDVKKTKTKVSLLNSDIKRRDKSMSSNTTKWSQRVAQSLSQCTAESALYASCVIKHIDDIEKNACNIEFQKFKQCIAKHAVKNSMITLMDIYNNGARKN